MRSNDALAQLTRDLVRFQVIGICVFAAFEVILALAF